MNIHTATEVAYKNGYNKGVEDTLNAVKNKLKENLIKPEFPWDEFFVTEGYIDNLFDELTGRTDDEV